MATCSADSLAVLHSDSSQDATYIRSRSLCPILEFGRSFEIRPRPPAAKMENGEPSTRCEIDEWSVKSGDRGDKIVVKTLCGPRSSAIYLGEVALTTRVRPRTIEAIFDSLTLDFGEQPLRLVDVRSGQAILLGNLRP